MFEYYKNVKKIKINKRRDNKYCDEEILDGFMCDDRTYHLNL